MLKLIFLAALFFILLTVALTFPLLVKITSFIPCFFSTDEVYGTIWDYWRVGYSIDQHLPVRYTHFIAAPFGFNMFGTGANYYFHWFAQNLLAKIISPIFSYNFQIFFNFVLGGVFTFLLTMRLGLKMPFAFFAGLIFAFCPYQFVRSWQHLSLTFNWLIVLCLLMIIILREAASRRNKTLFLLSIFLLFSFDYSVMYSTAIVLAVFVIYSFWSGSREKLRDINRMKAERKFLLTVSGLVLVAMVVLLPQLIAIFKNLAVAPDVASFVAHTYVKRFDDLFVQSVRPLSYFLPAAVHPIFGKFTEQLIGSSLYGISFTEHTLYLGWTPLVLAFFAFKRWRIKKKEFKKLWSLSFEDSPFYRENFYIGFFVFLAIVAWLFSQPPWWDIFGFKLYMPSFFMYKILPMFRAYCRFGIVVMLAVAVLAGFGLKFILERFKSQKTKAIVTALFCGLVLFEFWNWPPYKVIDLSKVPAVYYWIKEQPKDIVIADYPLDADSPNELYKFFQTVHEKKIINGTIPGTHANKVAQEIRRLSQPKTASILKWMGVKYVVVHKDDYLKTDLIEDKEDMERIPQNQGLKFVKNFPPQECPDPKLMCVQKTGAVDVYEVEAEPMEPRIKEELK